MTGVPAPPTVRPGPSRPALARAPFLVAGIVSLGAGLWAGLQRAGVGVAAPTQVAGTHGLLMVVGFLGAVISVERAVALERRWAWAAPALCAAGALLTALGVGVGPMLAALGTIGLAATFTALALLEPALHSRVMLGGTIAGAAATSAWALGATVPQVLPAWIYFVLWTIAGERLELTRLVRLPEGARAELVGWAVASGATALWAAVAPAWGVRAFGATLVGTALWLGRHDIARRTIRTVGLSRFSAACLLLGYAWLGVAGAAFAGFGPQVAGLRYDLQVHALFVGFVLSMILGHAPIIFPAVLRIQVPFRRLAWVPLVLIHATLLVRIAGDLATSPRLRAAGAVWGVVAVVAFLVTNGGAIVAAVWRRRPTA